MQRDAVLSSCGTYRYFLSRRWGVGAPLTFVMLNPSRADAAVDDPTIRKCIGFARRQGFDAIHVVNLFAYRATDPADLRDAGFPEGPRNIEFISHAALHAHAWRAPVVLAWGAQARGLPHGARVATWLHSMRLDVRALMLLADGTPAHPLMLPYASALVPVPNPAAV